MTVRTYKFSDTSAPQLSGTVSSIVSVLDAVLVNGYGTQVSSGWTKPFTGTNGAVFRQGTGSNQFFLNVDDNGPGAGLAKEARIRGFENMTAFATGTNLFPTVAQATNGLFVRKSTSADSIIRPWIIVADQRTFYMFVLTGDTVATWYGWMFGEFYSFKASDLGRTMIIARETENVSTSGGEGLDKINSIASTIAGSYIARDATGAVGAIASGKVGDMSLTTWAGSVVSSFGVVPQTNPSDNRSYLSPLRVTHIVGGNIVRGRCRGLWHWCHPITGCTNGDTFIGTGNNAGKTFMVLDGTVGGGIFVIEISNTWDTN